MKDRPRIHPPIPLVPAHLKNIREEQIEVMIIAPLWPGKIWYTELKNLKLPPGKIYCFPMDRRPEKEEDSQERF
ncbi:MAG: hypothetical protein EZS28_041029 [Streblomastix strix]|uniref:Uncharacterized protein n=1 Tax=Streblomastix strix TaxID=222440 RepID=A0A5J4U169_9EUKA|nr:MAG: hypothetical protein EZS28_041029 [Streblomastix strix]